MEEKQENVKVPEFLHKIGNGDFLTTMYGDIILVHHVEFTEKGNPMVYPYFDYDLSEDAICMNEWITGFYGPAFREENFYRPSTEDEQNLILEKMRLRGYEWSDEFKYPKLTREEFDRIRERIHIM